MNKEDFNEYLPTKTAFYEFMLRKKFFMPEFKSNLCTVAFMDRAFRDEILLPQQTLVHPVQLASPPTREQAKAILVFLLESFEHAEQPKVQNLCAEIKERDADLAWYLSMIQLLDKENPVLAAGYVNKSKQPKKEVVVDERLEAYKNAFEDVPKASRQQTRKRATVASQIQTERKPTKLQVARQELQALQAAASGQQQDSSHQHAAAGQGKAGSGAEQEEEKEANGEQPVFQADGALVQLLSEHGQVPKGDHVMRDSNSPGRLNGQTNVIGNADSQGEDEKPSSFGMKKPRRNRTTPFK